MWNLSQICIVIKNEGKVFIRDLIFIHYKRFRFKYMDQESERPIKLVEVDASGSNNSNKFRVCSQRRG